ncbi:MAG: VWA domain-containing protein [Candidatus Kapabacteria bacterium]|nr:VWA domain-containing protein [Candidatus Kapabacteria bacterium]
MKNIIVAVCIIASGLVFSNILQAQALKVIGTDASKSPIISAYLNIKDLVNHQFSLSDTNEFLLTDGGLNRSIQNIDCYTSYNSFIFVCDVSTSMQGSLITNGISRLMYMKKMLNIIVGRVPENSEICIITFSSIASLKCDFINISGPKKYDSVRVVLDSIYYLKGDGSTKYHEAFYGVPPLSKDKWGRATGALNVANRAKYKPIIFFMTDGFPDEGGIFDPNKVIFDCLNLNGIINTIAIGIPATQELKDMAQKTGGKYYETPDSMQCETILDSLAPNSGNYCTFSWLSDCTGGDVSLSWKKHSLTQNFQYISQPLGFTDSIISGARVYCGSEQINYTYQGTYSKVFKWTASNGNITGSSTDRDVQVIWEAGKTGNLSLLIDPDSTNCRYSSNFDVKMFNTGIKPIITGNSYSCYMDTVKSYSNAVNFSYQNWIAENGTIIGSDSSQIIKVIWTDRNNATLKLIVKSGNNSCSDSTTIQQQFSPYFVEPSISGSDTACMGWEQYYEIKNPSNRLTEWNLSGGKINLYISNSRVRVHWDSTGAGKLTVKVFFPDSCVQKIEKNFIKMNINSVDDQDMIKSLTIESISPTPFEDTFTAKINSTTSTAATFRIYSIMGEIVFSDYYYLESGENNIKISLPGQLSAGVYTLTVKTGNGSCEKQVLKLE